MENLKNENYITAKAKDVGSFVVSRLTGGAWAELAEQVKPEPQLTHGFDYYSHMVAGNLDKLYGGSE